MRYLLLVLFTALLVGLPAQGKPIQNLQDFTAREVSRLDKAVQEGTTPGSRDFEMKRFLLRVQAKAGFSIEVVNVELIPELELVWQKEAGVL